MWVASFIVNAQIIMATVSGEDVMDNFLIIVPFQASMLQVLKVKGLLFHIVSSALKRVQNKVSQMFSDVPN